MTCPPVKGKSIRCFPIINTVLWASEGFKFKIKLYFGWINIYTSLFLYNINLQNSACFREKYVSFPFLPFSFLSFRFNSNILLDNVAWLFYTWLLSPCCHIAMKCKQALKIRHMQRDRNQFDFTVQHAECDCKVKIIR